ncbi:MAG: hypothetical protein RLZ28_1352 [Actinomycetota bacterium]
MLRLFELDEGLLEPESSVPPASATAPSEPPVAQQPARAPAQPELAPAQPELAPAQPEPRPMGGQVVLLGATPGAPGATSLAINIAYELAQAKNRVCVIDFDFQSPNLLAMLAQESITAGLMGAKRLLEQRRLTIDELQRLLVVLNFDGLKLSILPGLGTPSLANEPFALKSALDLLEIAKSDFDYIVIDVGDLTKNLSFSKNLLKQVDYSFLVCAADPIGVRRFLGLHRLLGNDTALDSAQLIVNRVRESVLGPNPKRQLAETLEKLAGAEVCCFVPNDSLAFDQALLEGLPIQLISKASPAKHAIAMLVRQGILNQRSNLDWRLARHG